jgi:hypothetical protein
MDLLHQTVVAISQIPCTEHVVRPYKTQYRKPCVAKALCECGSHDLPRGTYDSEHFFQPRHDAIPQE